MKKGELLNELFKDDLKVINEGRTLRVFDLDDTLVKTTSYIYVNHKDGKTTKLDPSAYAVYNAKPGDEYDFSDFNKLLQKPKVIKQNLDLLKRMLSNPQKKVTILTARKLAFPIKKYFKDTHGLDVYVVALGSNNPQDKADWVEKHIKKGYSSIAFMDDSKKNIDVVDKLKKKYPNVEIKTKLIKEEVDVDKTVAEYINKLIN